MTLRHHYLDGIRLPDLPWPDEFDWAPIGQSVERGLDGALIVQVSACQAGRPITLAGGDDHAWVQRATLDQLYSLASDPGRVMALTLADGRRWSVIFRHGETPIEARPKRRKVAADPDDWYTLTLRFLSVDA